MTKKLANKYQILFPQCIQTTWSTEIDDRPSVFPGKGNKRFVRSRVFEPDKNCPGPTFFNVNCCGQRHQLEITGDWELVSHNHETWAEMQVMRVFGDSKGFRCLEVKELWDECRKRNVPMHRRSDLRKQLPAPARLVHDFVFGPAKTEKSIHGKRYLLLPEQKKPEKKSPSQAQQSLQTRLCFFKHELARICAERCGFPCSQSSVPPNWLKEVHQRGMDKAVDEKGNPIFIVRAHPHPWYGVARQNSVPVLCRIQEEYRVVRVWGLAEWGWDRQASKGNWIVTLQQKGGLE